MANPEYYAPKALQRLNQAIKDGILQKQIKFVHENAAGKKDVDVNYQLVLVLMSNGLGDLITDIFAGTPLHLLVKKPGQDQPESITNVSVATPNDVKSLTTERHHHTGNVEEVSRAVFGSENEDYNTLMARLVKSIVESGTDFYAVALYGEPVDPTTAVDKLYPIK